MSVVLVAVISRCILGRLCGMGGRGVLFFFQAEDGIRDLVRSRGLGDVYKRQPRPRSARLAGAGRRQPGGRHGGRPVGRSLGGHLPVSYTHLTLPTSDLV